MLDGTRYVLNAKPNTNCEKEFEMSITFNLIDQKNLKSEDTHMQLWDDVSVLVAGKCLDEKRIKRVTLDIVAGTYAKLIVEEVDQPPQMYVVLKESSVDIKAKGPYDLPKQV